MGFRSVREIYEERERVDLEAGEFLRRRGWVHTCDNVGALWLWRKEMEKGGAVCVGLDTALVLQQDMDLAGRRLKAPKRGRR